MNKDKLTAKDYNDALLSQNACNLSGLAHSLSEVLPRIWNESNGTDEVNNHAIVKLYLEQMNYLCKRDYFEASNTCEANK